MKLTIEGDEYPLVRVGDWTFDEAETVKRIAKLNAGQVFTALIEGDSAADLAYAVVGYIRADKDPEVLKKFTLDTVEVDLFEPEEETDAAGPPAVSDASANPRGRRGARSPRKS